MILDLSGQFSKKKFRTYFLDSRQDQEGNFQKVKIGLKYCNSKVDIKLELFKFGNMN